MIYSPYEAHRLKLGVEYDRYYHFLWNYTCFPFGPVAQEIRQLEEVFKLQAIREKLSKEKIIMEAKK